MPFDNDPPVPVPEAPQKEKPNWLDRMFDGKSDGRFVKRLLVIMLLCATVVQPVSLTYTAYAGQGEFAWENWWHYMPVLAIALFVALDWTILPLAYFFSTTKKVSLKIMMAIMLTVVAGGAFDGYFTATERLIAMRLEEITRHALKVEAAKLGVETEKGRLAEAQKQQAKDRTEAAGKRAELDKKGEAIDKEIAILLANAATDKVTHKENNARIEPMCKAVNYVCMGPKMSEEMARHTNAQKEFAAQIASLQANKAKLNDTAVATNPNDGKNVDAANVKIDTANEHLKEVAREFDVAVLNNQVYRWAGVLFGKSARDVTANEANTVLMIFAGMVAAGYVCAQVILSIAYYGRDQQSFLSRTKVNWSKAIDGARAYYARKRRGVYREKKVEVFVPTGERLRVVYVPVNPGGPVPPAEEFLTKPGQLPTKVTTHG